MAINGTKAVPSGLAASIGGLAELIEELTVVLAVSAGRRGRSP